MVKSANSLKLIPVTNLTMSQHVVQVMARHQTGENVLTEPMTKNVSDAMATAGHNELSICLYTTAHV